VIAAEQVRGRVSLVLEEARKIPAFVRRDFLVAWSYRMAFFSDWVTIILQVALFYFVGRLIDPARLPTFGGARVSYFQFVVVGIALASFLYVGLGRVVTVIRTEQLMGTLESLLLTPTSPLTLQLGSVAYDLLYLPVRTVIFLLLAWVLLGARFSLSGLGPAMSVLLAFIPVVWGLGMVSAAGVLTFRRGAGVVGLGTVALTATSSTYFPIEVLPGWLEAVAHLNPITIALGATREALLGRAGFIDVLPAILTLAPMAVVSLVLGVFAFRMALRRERRRGSLGLY
jgi:ABC-2 type transport system permease protein